MYLFDRNFDRVFLHQYLLDLNIFKNPINQRVSQMHQIHTSYFVNAQNYDFSNRNWVGPGPISTYETHTQSHITICLIRCKISSVSYKNKQADPGCPVKQDRTLEAPHLEITIFFWNPFFDLRPDLVHSWGCLEDWWSRNLILSTFFLWGWIII